MEAATYIAIPDASPATYTEFAPAVKPAEMVAPWAAVEVYIAQATSSYESKTMMY